MVFDYTPFGSKRTEFSIYLCSRHEKVTCHPAEKHEWRYTSTSLLCPDIQMKTIQVDAAQSLTKHVSGLFWIKVPGLGLVMNAPFSSRRNLRWTGALQISRMMTAGQMEVLAFVPQVRGSWLDDVFRKRLYAHFKGCIRPQFISSPGLRGSTIYNKRNQESQVLY